MRTIELTISFIDDRTTRCESHRVVTSYLPDASGEHRLVHNLLSELQVAVGNQRVPKHNAVARQWAEFPNSTVNFNDYLRSHLDIQNPRALWVELTSLMMGTEGDLILAEVFKKLEPVAEPSLDDADGLNDLFYIHDRKMQSLNQVGGNLVDTSKSNWEQYQLRRDKVMKGLEVKREVGELSEDDFDAINEALAIPENIPQSRIAISYRNRLTHHIRPSVDYGFFYSNVESRAGRTLETTKDSSEGNCIPCMPGHRSSIASMICRLSFQST